MALVSRRALLVILSSAPLFGGTASLAVERQDGWRWCRKCQGLWFAAAGSRGVCAAGGRHQREGSGNYRLVENSPGASGQPGTIPAAHARREEVTDRPEVETTVFRSQMGLGSPIGAGVASVKASGLVADKMRVLVPLAVHTRALEAGITG